jgi:hypothetical protein
MSLKTVYPRICLLLCWNPLYILLYNNCYLYLRSDTHFRSLYQGSAAYQRVWCLTSEPRVSQLLLSLFRVVMPSILAEFTTTHMTWSVGVFGDEAISLRVWGLMPRMGTPLECPDVPRGETPKNTPNPMIIEVKTIIPHQRANTRDPSIETPPFRVGRGHFRLSPDGC